MKALIEKLNKWIEAIASVHSSHATPYAGYWHFNFRGKEYVLSIISTDLPNGN